MTVRIGINPITWTNDDLPSLGGDTPVETCLAETRAAGFAGTEMGGKFPKTARELRPLLGAPSAWISSPAGTTAASTSASLKRSGTRSCRT